MLPKRRILGLLSCLFATAALALPDLTPQNGIYSITLDTSPVPQGDVDDGCAGATTGRTLVRFGVRTTNIGSDPLVFGDIGCPDNCATNSGAVCANPDFMCSISGTPRAVFISSARYELLDMAGDIVAVGAKRDYCFNDDGCTPPAQPVFTDCEHNQGLSSGCEDDYEPYLACQYIDATDVPGITTRAFRLRVTIDPNNILPDADRTNNVAEVVLPGCGDGIVEAGEDCDPGPVSAAPCCDPNCHFLPAGTACRPAGGPCEAAAVCDGTSDVCPPNPPALDGSSCGVGMSPCLDAVCAAGTCASRRDPSQGCLIDGACVPPDAVDSSDPCQRCDVTASAEAWSRNRDATPDGVQCEVAYVTAVAQASACPARTVAAVGRRLRHAGEIAARLTSAEAQAARALRRRLLRLSKQVARRFTGSPGCRPEAALAELGILQEQIRAMAAVTPR